MVVLDMLRNKVPAALILVCLLVKWNDQLPRERETRLMIALMLTLTHTKYC